MKSNKFNVTKVKVDGSDLRANSIIRQLRPFRLSLGIQQVQVTRSNPTVFKSSSHISALENGRQRETTTQIQAYANSLGIKEIVIKLSE